MSHFLQEMLHPRSIAVYGASGPMKMGTLQALSIIGSGFAGKVYYIHPQRTEVLGQRAYRSAAEIPGPVDLGLIVIPAPAVPAALSDLGRKGVRYAVVTSGGFAEVATDQGRSLHHQLREAAHKSGIRFVGPNCLGLVNGQLSLNTTTFPARIPPGSVSIASHSGSYTTQIFPYMEELEPGLGLRYVLSLGNEADVDVVDALDCFREDEQTKAVCLYLEGIRRGREFLHSALATARRKPVIVHFVGGNTAGRRAGSSHTAALGTDQGLAEGIFRQCGLIIAEGLGEMFDFARVLSQCPAMPGPRVAVVTNSGGPGASAAYTCERLGLRLPELSPTLKERISRNIPATAALANPVDFTFDTDLTRFREVCRTLLESEEIDAVLVYGLFVSGFFARRRELYKQHFPEMNMERVRDILLLMVTEVAKIPHQLHKPLVMASLMGPGEDGFRAFAQAATPAYPTPERAAKALAVLHQYWAWRRNQQTPGEEAPPGSASP